MTVLAEGNSKRNGGPKSFMLNKIENAFKVRLTTNMLTLTKGKKNNNKYCKYIYNNFHTKVAAKNRIGPHNAEIISVLFGSVLGDGYANSRRGCKILF